MPAMLLSKEEWKEVQRASEAGVDDQQLSEDYRVSKGAIRVRRLREGWLTPRKLAEQVAIAKAKEETRSMTNSVAKKSSNVTPVTSEESIAAKMLRDGEVAGLHAMKILLKKLAIAADDPDSVEDLGTVGDVVTAVKGARLIAGLDKQESSVQLNLGAFWSGPENRDQEKPVVVVEKPE